jgi:hypothetical protein
VRADLGARDRLPRADPERVEVLDVAAQVAPVRLDGVLGEPLLHAHVGEEQIEGGLERGGHPGRR